jgi:YggT family protein
MEAFGIKVLLLLISVIFSLYQFCVLLRFLLQAVKADFRNPFCQFLIKMTAPLLHSLRRVIPGVYGLDLAALVLFYLLVWVENSLNMLIIFQYWSAFSLVNSLIAALHFYLNIMFFIILINALLSFFPQAKFHPMGILIHLLADPYLRRIRRVLPLIGGFDFSALAALVLIQIINMGLATL